MLRMASSSACSTKSETSSEPASSGHPVTDKMGQDDQLLDQLYVGKSFSTFTDFHDSLDKLNEKWQPSFSSV